MQGDQICAQEALSILRSRARRYALFPAEIFDEHAWNMLLHLFVAHFDNEIMSESELIKRASTTIPVGRRWIAHLVTDAQVKARQDGEDVVLTAESIERLRQYLSYKEVESVASPA